MPLRPVTSHNPFKYGRRSRPLSRHRLSHNQNNNNKNASSPTSAAWGAPSLTPFTWNLRVATTSTASDKLSSRYSRQITTNFYHPKRNPSLASFPSMPWQKKNMKKRRHRILHFFRFGTHVQAEFRIHRETRTAGIVVLMMDSPATHRIISKRKTFWFFSDGKVSAIFWLLTFGTECHLLLLLSSGRVVCVLDRMTNWQGNDGNGTVVDAELIYGLGLYYFIRDSIQRQTISFVNGELK